PEPKIDESNAMKQFVPCFQPFNANGQSRFYECNEIERQWQEEMRDKMEAQYKNQAEHQLQNNVEHKMETKMEPKMENNIGNPVGNSYEQFRAPRRVVQPINPMPTARPPRNDTNYYKTNFTGYKYGQKSWREKPEFVVKEILKSPKQILQLANKNAKPDDTQMNDSNSQTRQTSVPKIDSHLETSQTVNSHNKEQLSQSSDNLIANKAPENARETHTVQDSNSTLAVTEGNCVSQSEAVQPKTPESPKAAQGPLQEPSTQANRKTEPKKNSEDSVASTNTMKRSNSKQIQEPKGVPRISRKKAKLLARKNQKQLQLQADRLSPRKLQSGTRLAPVIYNLSGPEGLREGLSTQQKSDVKVNPLAKPGQSKPTAPVMSGDAPKVPSACIKPAESTPPASPKEPKPVVPDKTCRSPSPKVDNRSSTQTANEATSSTKAQLKSASAQVKVDQEDDLSSKCVTPTRAYNPVLAPSRQSRSWRATNTRNNRRATNSTAPAKQKGYPPRVPGAPTKKKSAIVEVNKSSESAPLNKPVVAQQATNARPKAKEPIIIQSVEIIRLPTADIEAAGKDSKDSKDDMKIQTILSTGDSATAELEENDSKPDETGEKSSELEENENKVSEGDETEGAVSVELGNSELMPIEEAVESKQTASEETDTKTTESNLATHSDNREELETGESMETQPLGEQVESNQVVDEADSEAIQSSESTNNTILMEVEKILKTFIKEVVQQVEHKMLHEELPSTSRDVNEELEEGRVMPIVATPEERAIEEVDLHLASQVTTSSEVEQSDEQAVLQGVTPVELNESQPEGVTRIELDGNSPESASNGDTVQVERNQNDLESVLEDANQVENEAAGQASSGEPGQELNENEAKSKFNVNIDTSKNSESVAVANEGDVVNANPGELGVDEADVVQPFGMQQRKPSKKKSPRLSKMERKAMRREAKKLLMEALAQKKKEEDEENEKKAREQANQEEQKIPKVEKKKEEDKTFIFEDEESSESSSDDDDDFSDLEDITDPYVRRKLKSIIRKINKL
ncbi:hypothetical protein AWZ03_014282, partial [Drosophila navojoa]